MDTDNQPTTPDSSESQTRRLTGNGNEEPAISVSHQPQAISKILVGAKVTLAWNGEPVEILKQNPCRTTIGTLCSVDSTEKKRDVSPSTEVLPFDPGHKHEQAEKRPRVETVILIPLSSPTSSNIADSLDDIPENHAFTRALFLSREKQMPEQQAQARRFASLTDHNLGVPLVTFKDFVELMRKRKRNVDDLVDIFRDKLNDSRSFFERVMSCQWCNPETRRYEDHSDVVIPYKSVIEFYRKEAGHLKESEETGKAMAFKRKRGPVSETRREILRRQLEKARSLKRQRAGSDRPKMGGRTLDFIEEVT